MLEPSAVRLCISQGLSYFKIIPFFFFFKGCTAEFFFPFFFALCGKLSRDYEWENAGQSHCFFYEAQMKASAQL